MLNIKKSFFTSALIILSIFAQAQSINTYSPYSRYGIGQIPTRGFAATKAMGGVSQAVRNACGINYLNPASYTAQDTMSFILDFGFEAGATKYELQEQSFRNGFGGIHHVAISFPITKWWGASMGLVPYSQVGYQIKHYETDPIILSTIGRVTYYNQGTGGINQAFIGNAFKPIKNLSVGFNLYYYFGDLNYTSKEVFPSNMSGYNNIAVKNNIIVKDIALSFGAQYNVIINKKDNTFLTLGATIDSKTNIKAKQKYLSIWDYKSYTDTINFSDRNYGHITFPRNLSVGLAYCTKSKLFTSLEYSTQDWTNTSIFNEVQPLTKSQTYRFGLEYVPNPYDLKNYFKKVSYRFGSHFSNTYFKINDHQINEFGLSAGFGFPFRNNTKFNVSYEYGIRGTTSNGLVKETYGILSFSLSFYDFWFIKRRYN